ncbi:hypothetical protein [Agaribacterium haliotis]|uniref:hypothetical protein n=1 Tax=Agaribacterium haliotis TaxID=2013869 RepID=UPI00117812AC|nr:hypothetical protein [Agaribacterium haliotis]
MDCIDKFLKYGFVVFSGQGQALYDDRVKARMPYADSLYERLCSSEVPSIARLTDVVNGTQISSPVFKYEGSRHGIDSYQSAYYLTDALMRKGMLPVFLSESGEVKNILPLLTKEQRKDAMLVIQILQARYIKSDERHPAPNFMVNDEPEYDSLTLELSDSEILAIFGRLPDDKMEVFTPDLGHIEAQAGFIADGVIRRA